MMTMQLLHMAGFISATLLVGFNIIIIYDKKGLFNGSEIAALSYLFGIGAISIELFILGLCKIDFAMTYILAPWIILSVINIPRFRAIITGKTHKKENAREEGGILRMVVTVLLIFTVAYAFFTALVKPIESYDAVAIWSLKAKILYLARTLPSGFFVMVGEKFHGAHPDYPLLLPLSQVWFYAAMNSFNDYLVKILFPLNFSAFLVIFYAFLKKSAGNGLFALIFTFMLASVKHFSDYATNGYADMSMAIYGSITFLAVYLWIKEGDPAYLWTAFFSCIFSIWTKNEGAIITAIFVSLVAGHLIKQAKNKPVSYYRGAILAALIPAVLMISWAIFKISAAIQNDVVNPGTFARYDPSGIFQRAIDILYEYQKQAFGVKYWNLTWILFISVLILRFKKLFSTEDRYLIIPIFATLAAYAAIYFITPQNIEWHLQVSVNRLLLHILPLVIFYIAMRVTEIYSNE